MNTQQTMPVICPYCQADAEYLDSSEVYGAGHSYGMLYLCRPCDAYVGVHKGTDRPLGTLADYETRWWRKKAHGVFDPIWMRSSNPHRSWVYHWLAVQMGIPDKECHIGMFTVSQCKQVVAICKGMKGLRPVL